FPELRDYLLLPILIIFAIAHPPGKFLVMVPTEGMLPIDPMGIIKTEFHAVLSACGGQFCNGVAFNTTESGQTILSCSRVPYGSTVVMFGRNDDIFHACPFRQ